MKKTLIALAALAATGAFAQSTVTISGLFDAGYRAVDSSSDAKDTRGIAQSGSGTTAIVLSGSEDLGGGMKANFRYEMNPDFVGGQGLTSNGGTNTALTGENQVGAGNGANGYSFVGVAGGFGEVKLGRLNAGALEANGIANPFGTNVGSGYAMLSRVTSQAMEQGAGALTAPTRFNNAVEYISPAIAGGVTIRALYVPKVDQTAGTTVNRQGVTDISVKYANGPVAVMLGQQAISAGDVAVATSIGNAGPALAVGETNTLTYLAGSYAMGNLGLGAMYWTQTQSASKADIAAYRLSATYAMGAYKFLGTVANSDSKITSDVDQFSVGLGVDYSLSKRSTVYARYERTDTATSANTFTATTMVGVKHTF